MLRPRFGVLPPRRETISVFSSSRDSRTRFGTKSKALYMPCGKIIKSFVLNEFHGPFHIYFAHSSWSVHIFLLIFSHAMRPPCAYQRLWDVQYARSHTHLP